MSADLAPQVFVFGEVELATSSGIHISHFAAARKKLRAGVDWDLNNMRVAYSPAGMKAVLAEVLPAPLGPELEQVLTEEALLDKPQKSGAPDPAAVKEIEGTVTRIGGARGPWVNPLLMELELSDGTKVMLKVRTTVNFRRGMKCPLHWNDNTKTYELARRLPRFPGRW
jgi:hypothetical protein